MTALLMKSLSMFCQSQTSPFTLGLVYTNRVIVDNEERRDYRPHKFVLLLHWLINFINEVLAVVNTVISLNCEGISANCKLTSKIHLVNK
ncbi:unnamed protein product [Heterobilharzia americana]|nr:unnamed protein product [Heterobilharzia americana]